jgi:ABC-type multidrug transport system fused ATPase/permease subunit
LGIFLLWTAYSYFPSKYQFIADEESGEHAYESLMANSRTRLYRQSWILFLSIIAQVVVLVLPILKDFQLNTAFRIHSCHVLMWMITAITSGVQLGAPSTLGILNPQNYRRANHFVLWTSVGLFLVYVTTNAQLWTRFGLFDPGLDSFTWIPTGIVALIGIQAKVILNELRLYARLYHKDHSCKEMNATWFHRFTFSFVDDLIEIGFQKPLEYDDLDDLLKEDTSRAVLEEYHKKFRRERSLLMNLFVLVQKEFAWQQLATLVTVVTVIGGPYLLRLILLDIEDKSKPLDWQKLLTYSVLLFVISMIRSVSDGQLYFLGRRIGIRVRSVIIALVYEKSLKRVARSSSDIKNEFGSGKVTNLMSVDAAKVLEVCCYFMYVWATPLQSLIFILFLVQVAGLAGLAGLTVMILLIPIGTHIGGIIQRRQKVLMVTTDNRINAVNELLQGIRIVKFFAWEGRFEKKLEKLREVELKALWNYILLNASNKIIWSSAPVLVSFCTFFTMTMFSGRDLSISTAFTCLSIFQSLERPLKQVPDIVVKIMEALVSLKRVEEYIHQDELQDYINTEPNYKQKEYGVHFLPNSHFQWYVKTDSSPTSQAFPIHANFGFPKGKLSVVYGPTGAGKSSLLSSILGELQCVKGGVILEDGSEPKSRIAIAYVSQQGMFV